MIQELNSDFHDQILFKKLKITTCEFIHDIKKTMCWMFFLHCTFGIILRQHKHMCFIINCRSLHNVCLLYLTFFSLSHVALTCLKWLKETRAQLTNFWDIQSLYLEALVLIQVNSEEGEPFLDTIVREKLTQIINRNLIKILKQSSSYQIL